VDALAKLNGKPAGTNDHQEETYDRSEAAQLTFQEAFNNAESYTLAWWGE
jgi:hypothetical protein